MSPYEGAKDGKHYWLTPPDLYAALDDEFRFDFDPCPYPLPDGFDGLENEWGQSNYVNPPFKGPTKWVRKAIAEAKKGKRVVFVFPIDKWIHYMIEAGAEIRNLRDVRWCATEDGKPGKGTGRWIAAFILGPKKGRAEALRGWVGNRFTATAEDYSAKRDLLAILDDYEAARPLLEAIRKEISDCRLLAVEADIERCEENGWGQMGDNLNSLRIILKAALAHGQAKEKP